MSTTSAANESGRVGAHEAKTNLGQLLTRVERGEVIVITRHGRPVARLVPVMDVIDQTKVGDAVKRILDLRKVHTLGGDSLEDLIAEGREA